METGQQPNQTNSANDFHKEDILKLKAGVDEHDAILKQPDKLAQAMKNVLETQKCMDSVILNIYVAALQTNTDVQNIHKKFVRDILAEHWKYRFRSFATAVGAVIMLFLGALFKVLADKF